MRSNATPALAICGMVTWPVPYAIALGAVEMGSMKPKDAPSVAPSAGGATGTSAARASEIVSGSMRVAVAVLLAAGSVSGGDPDVADLLFKKGKKALSGKDYKEAEQCFRRAVREMSPFPDARFGLAEALEKLERPREALEASLQIRRSHESR